MFHDWLRLMPYPKWPPKSASANSEIDHIWGLKVALSRVLAHQNFMIDKRANKQPAAKVSGLVKVYVMS